MDCCAARGYAAVFDEKHARKAAQRYRTKGLDPAGTKIVDLLRRRGIAGASVLEIGGGIGSIALELLTAGAERARILELSPAYDEPALELARERGVADRVERRLGDVAEQAELAEPADVVVLHAVVCCYPRYEQLLAAAADHARRLLVFSHPPRNLLARFVFAGGNAWHTVRRRELRGYVHPPEAMRAVLEHRGLARFATDRTFAWRIAAHERDAAPPAAQPLR